MQKVNSNTYFISKSLSTLCYTLVHPHILCVITVWEAGYKTSNNH